MIVKVTKAATGTILYSEHAIEIDSHNGQCVCVCVWGGGGGGRGLLPNITGMCVPGFELNLFWKSNTYFIPSQGLIFLSFTHFHH